MLRLTTLVVVAVALAACSKKSNEKNPPAPAKGSDVGANAGSAAGSAEAHEGSGSAVAAGSGAGSAAPAAPARSLTGDLAVSGSLTGTYHWNKKGDLSCGPGGLHIDFTKVNDHDTSGANGMAALDDNPNNDGPDDDPSNWHDITLDVYPNPPDLSIGTTDLPAPMKTSKGFTFTPPGDDHHIHVTIDTTLTDIIVDPDAPKPKKSKKKVKKPAGPKVTIKGTLDIDCPPLPK